MIIEIKLEGLSGEGKSGYDVITTHVSKGDHIKHDDLIMVIESDKAVLDITSQIEGIVEEIRFSQGEKIYDGDIYLRVDAPENSDSEKLNKVGIDGNLLDSNEKRFDLVVIGAGPGGYTAAFRAADLGLSVALVERYNVLGGCCLNVGCIPSKSLLHVAKVINEAKEVAEFGVKYSKPKVDLDKLRSWKSSVMANLTDGIRELANLRNVKIFHGHAKFINSNQIMITDSANEDTLLEFESAIIAAGSRSTKVPFLPEDSRILDSADALSLDDIPGRLLIIGAGIIGLEMATVYDALGSKVPITAKYDQLIPECDADIVRPLFEHNSKNYDIYLETLVTKVMPNKKELVVYFDGKNEVPDKQCFDKILVCIGRHPNGHALDADLAGIYVNESGFITVDKFQRTNIKNIYAIGDITGKPMLAHKALYEAKIAAEVIAGLHSRSDAAVIPSVAFTDPEVAWVGLTEKRAKKEGIAYGVGTFPWAASGRALSLGRGEGKTKILFDLVTEEIIGAGIVGTNAGDLIAEVGLAIENRIKAKDLTATIHPHPTLSETVAFATEVFESTITDLYLGHTSTQGMRGLNSEVQN